MNFSKQFLCSSKSDLCSAGFTLIELLVVVLIIGILSSVALPQYTKAVDKARVSTVLSLGKALSDAENVFYMENGKYTADISELAVDVPEIKDFTLTTYPFMHDDGVSQGGDSSINSVSFIPTKSMFGEPLEYTTGSGYVGERSVMAISYISKNGQFLGRYCTGVACRKYVPKCITGSYTDDIGCLNTSACTF